jgi:hypothetical protein
MKSPNEMRLFLNTAVLSSCLLIAAGSSHLSIKAAQLDFLRSQSKPLFVSDVIARLGKTEIGNGPNYEYNVSGSGKTVQFWLRPPPNPPPKQIPKNGIPVEIVFVTEKAGPNSVIIWPENMRKTSIRAALHSFYPKMSIQPQGEAGPSKHSG